MHTHFSTLLESIKDEQLQKGLTMLITKHCKCNRKTNPEVWNVLLTVFVKINLMLTLILWKKKCLEVPNRGSHPFRGGSKIVMACLRTIFRDESQTVGNSSQCCSSPKLKTLFTYIPLKKNVDFNAKITQKKLKIWGIILLSEEVSYGQQLHAINFLDLRDCEKRKVKTP